MPFGTKQHQRVTGEKQNPPSGPPDPRKRTAAQAGDLNGGTSGVNEYATPDEFKGLLRQHLDELFHRRLGGEPRQIKATIPDAYLEWLRRECADVSLLGQERQQGQALTLSHVYVPAVTLKLIHKSAEYNTVSGAVAPPTAALAPPRAVANLASARRYVYVWADGVYLQARMEEAAECILRMPLGGRRAILQPTAAGG